MEDEIKKKKKEIEDYKQILLRYNHGRWLNMGERHLEELQRDLEELENKNSCDPWKE